MASLLSLPATPRSCLSPKTLANPRQIAAFRSASFDPRLGRRNVNLWKGLAVAAAVEEVAALAEEKRDETQKKPIVVIDNYDSFTYNICQYLGETGATFEVYRNDELTVEELKRKNPRGLLISPGPGTPKESGISLQTVVELGPLMPLFGVCMGLQCIGEAFGGKIVRAPSGVVHGKRGIIYHDENQEDSLFKGLPKYKEINETEGSIFRMKHWRGADSPFVAGRYHSLVIENESFPSDVLEITAWTEDGLIMAARHKKYKHILGVQFHPESVITEKGRTMIVNFIKLIEKFEASQK